MNKKQLNETISLNLKAYKNSMHILFSALLLTCIAAFIYSSPSVAYEKLLVDAIKSEVSFAGEHVGMKFKGIFKKWQAELVLPPAASPKIIARFDITSAKTGDSTYDSTLPEADWFNVKRHPRGVFESSSVNAIDNNYAVSGTLTLRGISKPVTFLLVDKGSELTANFTIDRLAYKIGFDSDPNAEWVSRDIKMAMRLKK